MMDLKLDGYHDLLIRDGRLVLVEGANQTAQQIKIALLTFFGEWFMDTTIGVPYFEQVLIKSPEKAKIENVFRRKILEVTNVKRVLALKTEFDRQARALMVSFEVQINNGVIRDKVSIRVLE